MNISMVTNTTPISRKKQNAGNEARRKGEVVHSGHFMISSVADDQEDLGGVNLDRDSPVHHEQSIMIKHGYDFSNVSKEPKNTYQFGSLPSNQITIDASLARLFQCMSLAYQGGKVVSPKWKNFKGLKLTVKDKIRLNNAIWRTWHIQYVLRKRKEQSLIQFATPWDVDYNTHAKPEAVVMEGKYWKRRIETVVAEYKKWRAYFMEKLRLSDYPGLVWVSETNSPGKEFSEFELARSIDESYMTDFTDTLFSSLSQQPFQFPNPREIAMHATNSDMIQPGLLQLQPIMDEFIEFDPFQDLISPPKRMPTVSFAGASNQQFTSPANDIFPGDFNLESHTATDATKLTSTMNNQSLQSMDFIDSFNVNPKQMEYSVQQQQTTADPIFSAVNVDSVSFYPSNTVHQQSHAIQQLPASLSINNQTLQAAQFNNVQKQQQLSDNLQGVMVKVNESANLVFMPENGTDPSIMNRNVETHTYPHSKLGGNTPANKFIYSQPQISQPADFNVQHNPGHVMIQQNSIDTMQPAPLQPAIHQRNVANMLRNHQVVQSNMRVTMPGINNPACDVQQGTSSNPSSSTASNVVMLKQLLTNSELFMKSSNPYQSAPRQNNFKKVQTSPRKQQRVRSKPPQQQNPLVPPQTPQLPVIGINSGPSQQPHPPAMRGEKQQSMDFIVPDVNVQEPWPQVHSSSSSSPVKGIVQDVDMELPLQEPASPLSPDPEIAQMELLQRQGSFSTEQKRRFNIKIGFARLQKLLPGGGSQPNTKISKATLMNKAAQFIKVMQTERTKVNGEIHNLKQDLDKLKLSINTCQQQLPATGAPVPRPKTDEAKNLFKAWVRQRTQQDWKFYFFGVITRAWFDTYHQRMGSISGMNDFSRMLFEWVEHQCSLRVLRPGVVQSLQFLSTTTNILTNPAQMRQQIEESAAKKQPDSRPRGSS